MKKIFTLIAAVAMTLGAQAQETLKLDPTATYTDGQVLATANAQVTLGNDMNAWEFENAEVSGDYAADFIVACKDNEGKDINGVVNIHGSNNPKDGTTSGSGSGIDCSEGKTSASIPQNGTWYVFTAKTAGKVKAGVVLNADKEFYLLDCTNAAGPDAQDKIRVELPASNITNYVIKDATGAEVTLADGAKGGKKVTAKVVGFLEFTAEANKQYWFFCSGSKLGFFGYTFTAGEGGGEGQGGEGQGGEGGEGGESGEQTDAEAATITFGENGAPVELQDVFEVNGFKLTRTDTGSKHAIDSNNAWFGDATAQVKYGTRLKVGGKSGDKNSLKLTVAGKGTVKICVREASSTADRNLVLTQNGTVLYDQIVKNDDAATVVIESAKSETNPTGETSVYPIISVPVVAGDVLIGYPNGALNFYAFEFVPEGSTGIQNVSNNVISVNAPMFNLAGQKVGKDFKGVVIMNGKKFMNK